ncbi:MAG TPA: hypothetical protein VN324_00410, partial [Quisquiliibacterium sp.]|nr:hypothetical protein [Quisquiliibacterium sp.]
MASTQSVAADRPWFDAASNPGLASGAGAESAVDDAPPKVVGTSLFGTRAFASWWLAIERSSADRRVPSAG